MNVTLADVARAAGISPSTVSRALSAPGMVNVETAKRVRRIAREMGYVSSHVPRQPAGPRTEAIGLIVPDIANPFFPPIIKAVQARAGALGRTVAVADVDEYAADEIRRAEFLASRVDGLIIASARSADEQLEELNDKLPLVLVNRQHPNISNVTIENAAGIHEAVEHLAALGHRTISYLNGPKRSWSNTQRQTAVREACAQNDVELIEFGPFEPQIQAGAHAADLLNASPATAVIAYDDLIALGVMARLTERGVRVGPEMSVVGIDDSPMSGMAYPTLTTVHVPGAHAGVQAVDMLLDLIDAHVEGEPSSPLQRSTQIETRLLVRSSTAPAPSRA
ncbi:LacI family transcriptional regulator [Georgenia satyanarayanai]|uniref:LacI family DNA-binding transcriptional regulator n=1 Tax=Georgenia satyanarayanai TaxID=860221 RepID=UPI00203DCDFB|nr:LacI family DNA-binding transcriptional regulator [Georgenia satyanarayanai]MCM3661339.1 LacI family transcriptional regulator [Georgenia satyanarayanai]